MNRSTLLAALLAAGLALAPFGDHVIADEQPLFGYSAESSRIERQWEEKLRAIPSPENLRAYMQRLSARPHHVGSPYDKDNAEWIASKFKEFGLDTHIEQFDVLFPTPKERVVELVEGGSRFVAKLQEPVLPQDPTSSQQSEQLPTYNAYSIDGDVTAPLVYVNYGIPEDYEQLERLGISVKGKIVIARYYHSWRGIKPKVAAEHGAVGCLIFSDPHEDGFVSGETFPKGAYRPPDGVQRGSVADMPYYPGDPLTPGIGATKDAKRLKIEEAPTITKIPVLPISYADAQPLLAALTGPVAPQGWRGGLAITYHVGPGAVKVHLKVKSNWATQPAYDVIGRIPGSTFPDEWVIRGNHHDAWVNGAEDPISGLIAVLEEARALGELVKSGWKPKRTIIYCAWDAEEPGLLGSTEWAEAHAQELQQKAVVYVNSDGNSRGYLSVGGSHTLERFVNDVARDVIDPEKEVPVAERWRARRILNSNGDLRREARERADVRIDPLGSGSDYTPFLQHLGIATLNIGYGGEGETSGVYHSIYDSFDHYLRFADPTFDYAITLSKTGGRAVLRFANADYLPLSLGSLSDTVSQYVKEVMKLATDERDAIAERNRQISEKTFDIVDDPVRKLVVPKPETPAPFINFAPLQNALSRLEESCRNYDNAMRDAAAAVRLQLPDVQQALDDALRLVELAMITDRGLPRRPWFTHQIYAPGFYTGYGVKTLPGIREAIEQHNWNEASEQIVVVANTLERTAAQIDRARAVIVR